MRLRICFFAGNQAEAISAIDMCVVPTLTFDLLFAFLVLGHGRGQLLWFEVTRHSTAEWLARQITEVFPWTSAPAYLVRDNDRAYGHVFTSRVRAMDQMLIFGEAHLRRILLPMRRITIRRVRTWHYGKMRPLIEQFNDLAPLSPFRSWLDCTINTSGCDFRKGQPSNAA